MSEVFIALLNRSIAASFLVLAVMIWRWCFAKAPRWITCLLWGVVALRLVVPFSFESVLSLVPSAQTVPPSIVTDAVPVIHSGIPLVNMTVNPLLSQAGETTREPWRAVLEIAPYVWVLGMLAVVIYGIVSYVRLRRRVRVSLCVRENVYLCDDIDMPFILGFLHPRIYVPSGLDETAMRCIIAHETAHLRRHDHWIKPLAFMVLAVYWFNPVMWIAYTLLCRDIEKACDERVIKEQDADFKITYSQTLVACSTGRRLMLACPLAFGEVGVKERVRSVLSYKKPTLWLLVAALAASVLLGVCFLTDPIGDAEVYTLQESETDHEMVGVRVTELFVGEEDGYLTMEWENRTGTTISYGEEFHVYRRVFGLRIPCRDKNEVWYAILNTVQGETATRSISLWGIDLSSKGEYVLEFSFRVEGDDKDYTAFLRFRGEDEDAHSSVTTPSGDALIWKYNPMLSATFHYALPLHFDMAYTHIEASCDEGNLWGYETAGQPLSKTQRFEAGQTVHWNPCDEDSDALAKRATITFTVYDGETAIYTGRVSLVRVAYDPKPHTATYELSLADTVALRLMNDPNGIYGYVILPKDADLVADNTHTWDKAVSFVYPDSVDMNPPIVRFWSDNTFEFTYSALSSYLARGVYTVQNGRWILTTNDDYHKTYCFTELDNGCLRFDASLSSPVEKFVYQSGGKAQCPVPDGAVFEPLFVGNTTSYSLAYE